MSTAVGARKAPKDIASTIAKTKTHSVIHRLFLRKTQEKGEGVQFDVLGKGVSSRVRNKPRFTSSVWSSCFIVSVRLTRPDITCQHNGECVRRRLREDTAVSQNMKT